jgi:hypothetical protein
VDANGTTHARFHEFGCALAELTRTGGKFQISSNFSERFGSLKTVRLDSHVRRKLISYSIFGGVFITLLAIALRSAGIYRPVPYLTYSGSYLMQAFFQRFLEWIPWKYADNLISELLLFFVLNVLGYAFVIFLLLRIFFPDRSGELPPLTGKK